MPAEINVQIDASAAFDAGHATHNLLIDAQASNRGNTVNTHMPIFEYEALARLQAHVPKSATIWYFVSSHGLNISLVNTHHAKGFGQSKKLCLTLS